jgi:chromosomal replication initiator protein
VTVPDIIELVLQRFAVKRADLLGKKRSKSVAHPRQIGMYLARELSGLSLEEIGSYFGGRDHTTVRHAVKRIGEQRQEDSRLNLTLEELSNELRHRRREPEREGIHAP